MELFIFLSSSVQKLEPKETIFWEVPKKSSFLALTFEGSLIQR
jgi:hypothetical protein